MSLQLIRRLPALLKSTLLSRAFVCFLCLDRLLIVKSDNCMVIKLFVYTIFFFILLFWCDISDFWSYCFKFLVHLQRTFVSEVGPLYSHLVYFIHHFNKAVSDPLVDRGFIIYLKSMNLSIPIDLPSKLCSCLWTLPRTIWRSFRFHMLGIAHIILFHFVILRVDWRRYGSDLGSCFALIEKWPKHIWICPIDMLLTLSLIIDCWHNWKI